MGRKRERERKARDDYEAQGRRWREARDKKEKDRKDREEAEKLLKESDKALESVREEKERDARGCLAGQAQPPRKRQRKLMNKGNLGGKEGGDWMQLRKQL